jgi:hypothetical protein
MKTLATLLVAAGLSALATSPSSAMPVGNLAAVADNNVQDVRIICGRHGRCFSTHRRYGRYYGGPSYYSYGPSYGYGPYYGRSYGYSPYWHRPGVGFSFRF